MLAEMWHVSDLSAVTSSMTQSPTTTPANSKHATRSGKMFGFGFDIQPILSACTSAKRWYNCN